MAATRLRRSGVVLRKDRRPGTFVSTPPDPEALPPLPLPPLLLHVTLARTSSLMLALATSSDLNASRNPELHPTTTFTTCPVRLLTKLAVAVAVVASIAAVAVTCTGTDSVSPVTLTC